MTPVRLEPAALRSQVKHSTTEPLHFHIVEDMIHGEQHIIKIAKDMNYGEKRVINIAEVMEKCNVLTD